MYITKIVSIQIENKFRILQSRNISQIYKMLCIKVQM